MRPVKLVFEATHSPKLNFTPSCASSWPTELMAFAAASQPPSAKKIPFHPYANVSENQLELLSCASQLTGISFPASQGTR